MPHTEALPVLSESDLVTETGLPAREIHGRLVVLSKAQHRVESALAFYLLEIERRALFVELGHASTVDYARECLGLEDRKTRTLLGLACRLERLPRMKEAFRLGELPYTKAREAVLVATPETDEHWTEKCRTLTNRQIEQEVRRELPPERSKLLFFSLDESRIAVWERVREGMERLAGKTLTDIEVWDLICAEALCTYDTTPPLGDESAPIGGYVREVIERDGFQCTRPGCSNRSCLTGNHIQARSLGGTEDPVNLHTVCIVCHHAIETGRLKVSGRAPEGLTWEGPFGVIERPLKETMDGGSRLERADGSCEVRETASAYGLSFLDSVPRGSEEDDKDRRLLIERPISKADVAACDGLDAGFQAQDARARRSPAPRPTWAKDAEKRRGPIDSSVDVLTDVPVIDDEARMEANLFPTRLPSGGASGHASSSDVSHLGRVRPTWVDARRQAPRSVSTPLPHARVASPG